MKDGSNRKNGNKKISRMSIADIRTLMLQMQNDGHSHMKKYEHLQKQLRVLKIKEVAKEIEE